MNRKNLLLGMVGALLASLLIWGLVAAINAYQYYQEAVTFQRYSSVDYSRKALAANPNDSYAYEGIANNEVMQHQYDAAARDFRKAWQINPDNHRAAGELCAVLDETGHQTEALEVATVMATYRDRWGDSARKMLLRHQTKQSNNK